MPRTRTARAFSAGGVLFRLAMVEPEPAAGPGAHTPGSAEQRVEIVLVGRAAEDFWVLPKGTPQPDETNQQVAVREVTEETGVIGRILDEIGSIHYWFTRRGVRYNKEVLYYLMEAVSGDVALHDHEYDDARWFPSAEALGRLVYPNEADMVRRALEAIAHLLSKTAVS